MSGFRQGFLQTNGIRLHYAAAGAQKAPLLLLVHGFPEFWYSWRHQLNDFAATHHVVALDNRGFNLSDKPEGDAAYRTNVVVRDLVGVADYFGADRFVLAGHDWGGAAAWAFALSHPERLERLIILNAPHPWILQKRLVEERDQRTASAYINMFREPGAAERMMADGGEAFYAWLMGDLVTSGAVDNADRDLYLEAWRRPGAMHAMLGWYRSSPIVVPGPDELVSPPSWFSKPFPRLKVPTRVIWGIRDTLLLPSLLNDLDQLVPDLSIDRIDAGHFLTQEAPEAVTAAMRRALL